MLWYQTSYDFLSTVQLIIVQSGVTFCFSTAYIDILDVAVDSVTFVLYQTGSTLNVTLEKTVAVAGRRSPYRVMQTIKRVTSDCGTTLCATEYHRRDIVRYLAFIQHISFV